MFGRFFDEDLADDPEMIQGVDKDELVDELVQAASIFAFMGYADSDESFIFWDDDFLFYDEPGGLELFIGDRSNLGFATGSDECESISGSFKKKIGDEGDWH